MGHDMTVTRRWLLPFDTLAPSIARAHAHAAAGGPRSDDAVLVVSELVGNAIRHAHAPIELELSASPSHLRIAVTATHHPGEPTPAERDQPDGAGGAGLRLVQACTDRWGWDLAGLRLTVHAEIALS